MIGQPPRARLRLIATDNPDFAATRELYCRIAATRETDPDPLRPSSFEDWPDAPAPEVVHDYASYVQKIAGLILGTALGVLWVAALARL